MLELQRESYPEVRLVLVEIDQSLAVAAAELGENGNGTQYRCRKACY